MDENLVKIGETTSNINLMPGDTLQVIHDRIYEFPDGSIEKVEQIVLEHTFEEKTYIDKIDLYKFEEDYLDMESGYVIVMGKSKNESW